VSTKNNSGRRNPEKKKGGSSEKQKTLNQWGDQLVAKSMQTAGDQFIVLGKGGNSVSCFAPERNKQGGKTGEKQQLETTETGTG